MKYFILSIGFTMALATASPVFAAPLGTLRAAVASSTQRMEKIENNKEQRISLAKSRAEEEIVRRIEKLTAASAAVQSMMRLTTENKTSLQAAINTQIEALKVLNVKINSDTDIETLKADVQSITKSYRIFALVIPQGHITVAADKILFVATNIGSMSQKLSLRIDAAEAAGNNVSEMKASLEQFNLKVLDAKNQAQAAIVLVAGLVPDNGDTAKMNSNQQSLKDARVKLKVAAEDIVFARTLAGEIVKKLKALHLDGNASTTVITP